jgi:hypothetical protein
MLLAIVGIRNSHFGGWGYEGTNYYSSASYYNSALTTLTTAAASLVIIAGLTWLKVRIRVLPAVAFLLSLIVLIGLFVFIPRMADESESPRAGFYIALFGSMVSTPALFTLAIAGFIKGKGPTSR